MSPGSTSLPAWDNMQAMSPYMSPDMNSIASGSMMGQKWVKNVFEIIAKIYCQISTATITKEISNLMLTEIH